MCFYLCDDDCTGHSVAPYRIHAGKTVPIVRGEVGLFSNQGYILNGMVVAVNVECTVHKVLYSGKFLIDANFMKFLMTSFHTKGKYSNFWCWKF